MYICASLCWCVCVCVYQIDADEVHRVCALVGVRERSKVDILRTKAHTLCTSSASI